MELTHCVTHGPSTAWCINTCSLWATPYDLVPGLERDNKREAVDQPMKPKTTVDACS